MKVQMSAPNLGWRERVAVNNVLKSGQLSMGSKVVEFEQALSQFQGSHLDVAAVNSGTSALHLGLLAMNLSPSDEVIVPAFTFAATANAVVMAGAKPVFADVEVGTMNLSAEKVAAQVTSNTKAVIFVSLYGNLSGISEVARLCAEKGIALVEDAAQSLGGEEHGIRSGGFGMWAAYSFYPTKHITTGEGGAVISGDASFLHRVKLLRNQGMSVQYDNEVPGLNNRMTDVAASLGVEQMKRAEKFLAKRRRIAAEYASRLDEIEGIQYQAIMADNLPSYNQFTIRVETNRDLLQTDLLKLGVQTRVYYPKPISDLAPFAHLGANVPNARTLASQVLSIPMNPKLTKRQVAYASASIAMAAKFGA